MSSLYKETMDVWGVQSQIYKFSEELGELLVAMHHWHDNKVYPISLAEEIADVEIVCGQLRQLVGEEMVDERKVFKLRRLRKKVDDAKEAGRNRYRR